MPESKLKSGTQLEDLHQEAVRLLQTMIATPSFSREEGNTALLIAQHLQKIGIEVYRDHNNIWAISENHPPGSPTVLLNSHHDTVRPSRDWKQDPFKPVVSDDRLTGLGSNDAGASVVSLISAFKYLRTLPELPYRLIVAITAEEEISGKNGVRSILGKLGPIDLGVVGEPTGMQMATAEKGLIVLDCIAKGKAGHAARDEGVNALYVALQDIDWFRTFKFDRKSELLGATRMTVTQINAGQQHNMIPEECQFVVDIRTNEKYSNEEVIEIIKSNISSELSPRSYHLNSSAISHDHPIVKIGKDLGLTTYGSPTLSDQAMMDFPTIKMGPGESSRSHTAGEHIFLPEIDHGIRTYIRILENLNLGSPSTNHIQ